MEKTRSSLHISIGKDFEPYPENCNTYMDGSVNDEKKV